MKKKGLIIATIVMVLVLAVSLTTATYAWFTASSSVAINDIALAITSNAKVNVGVRTTGTMNSGTSSYTNYFYETLASSSTDNTVSWDTTEATSGLGSTLTFSGLDLGVNMAIGTGTASGSTVSAVDSASFDVSGAFGGTKAIVKAPSGANDETAKLDDAEVAVANKDYLHAIIGIEANANDITGMYAKVVVSTTDAKSIIGMNAALHFLIKTENGTVDFEPFGAVDYNAPKSAATATSASAAGGKVDYNTTNAGQLTSVFYFWIDNTATVQTGTGAGKFATNGAEIRDFEIFAFIEGADGACNSNALGTSCKIQISFDGTANNTLLSDGTTTVASCTFLTFA